MVLLIKQSDAAYEFIKRNKKLLFDKFANSKIYQPQESPLSLFMAGSPGAGKTEYSKSLIKMAKNFARPIVRIDADEIREIIPQYNGHNSDVVQRAASAGVHKLYDYVLKHKLDAIIDGTFAKYKVAYGNVKRSLGKNRRVGIYCIYQDPLIAWEFTKKREKLEGRRVPKRIFIDAFLNARINANKIKLIFKNQIKLHLVIKNYSNNIYKFYADIDNIDKYLKDDYTKKRLNKLLKRVIL